MPIPWIRFINWHGAAKEISLRERCFGGAVRNSAWEAPEGTLKRSRRVLLLVHGFNVSLCDAEKSYRTFCSSLPLRWHGRTMWIYWPGDATLPTTGRDQPGGRLSAAWSVLQYPSQPDHAEQSAQVLTDYIGAAASGRRSPIRLSIVAHSLGCRMTLELIRLLRALEAAGLVRLELVVLMAAAVPQYLCKPNQRYDLGVFRGTDFVIYYSSKDEVLFGAFRPGQIAAATNPASRFIGRAAVGRKGLAGQAPQNVEQRRVSHRHGEYWPDRAIALATMEDMDGRVRRVSRRFMAPRLAPGGREMAGRPLNTRAVRGPTSKIVSTCQCQ